MGHEANWSGTLISGAHEGQKASWSEAAITAAQCENDAGWSGTLRPNASVFGQSTSQGWPKQFESLIVGAAEAMQARTQAKQTDAMQIKQANISQQQNETTREETKQQNSQSHAQRRDRTSRT